MRIAHIPDSVYYCMIIKQLITHDSFKLTSPILLKNIRGRASAAVSLLNLLNFEENKLAKSNNDKIKMLK